MSSTAKNDIACRANLLDLSVPIISKTTLHTKMDYHKLSASKLDSGVFPAPKCLASPICITFG